MQKPIIAVDVDDVLANSTESFRLHVNKTYGANLQPADYAVPGEYHKYYERVWESHGLQEKISKSELNRQMIVDQSHVIPHTKAYEVLQELSYRYELIVLTARNPSWENATHQWLEAHFPDLFSRVMFGGQHDSSDNKTKGDLCAEIGAKWLINDNVVHCASATNRGVTAILYGTYGWHQDIPKALIRCKNWSQIEKYFREQQ